MRWAFVHAAACALACAGAPAPDVGSATVWGYVTLVPKTGAAPSEAAYGDRRVQGATLFDYSHPRFAVVYAPSGPAAPARSHRVVLEPAQRGVRFAPERVAMGSADELTVENRTSETQIVSAPAAGWLHELPPGASAVFRSAASGELEIHALGTSARPALVWVASGVYAPADSTGRYELRGLEAGSTELRAWHPRLPPSSAHTLMLRAGEVARVDLEIGVDRGERSAQ
jgi:hypothetical protein